jgi:hypothetical protein
MAVTDLGDGTGAKELALVDPAKDRVLLGISGGQPVVFRDHTDGLDTPSAVAFADLTGDGQKDLIVANTGGNNVLVYPGLGPGRFGPEVSGGQGFAVGSGPASITVADVNGDGIPDLVVCDRGSNDVAILFGQGTGVSWTLTAGPRLQAGIGPVESIVQDLSGDGKPDILVSDGSSNTVTMFANLGGGMFDQANSTVYQVGKNPGPLFVGHFLRDPGVDLVTVNAGSNDLTLIPNFLGAPGPALTVQSGGLRPVSAIAGDFFGDGQQDLVVANYADGRISLLRPGPGGLELQSVVTEPGLPHPTSLMPAAFGPAGVSFFATTAGQDSAELLTMPLPGDTGSLVAGVPSTFLAPPSFDAAAFSAGEAGVSAELVPLDGSAIDMVAVLWSVPGGLGGTIRSASATHELSDAIEEIFSSAVLPPPQLAVSGKYRESSRDEPPQGMSLPPGPDSPAGGQLVWTRFVMGLDEAFDRERRAAHKDAEPGVALLEAEAPALEDFPPGPLRNLVPALQDRSPIENDGSRRGDEPPIEASEDATYFLWPVGDDRLSMAAPPADPHCEGESTSSRSVPLRGQIALIPAAVLISLQFIARAWPGFLDRPTRKKRQPQRKRTAS